MKHALLKYYLLLDLQVSTMLHIQEQTRGRIQILIPMARKGVRVLSFVILMMAVCVSSDFAHDKAQCQDQLLGLSSCLEYVTGDVKTPTPSCCTELSKDLINNTLCLCILVRDRNEPNLGFKLNATLALRLPSFCHVKSKATDCPGNHNLTFSSTSTFTFKILRKPFLGFV